MDYGEARKIVTQGRVGSENQWCQLRAVRATANEREGVRVLDPVPNDCRMESLSMETGRQKEAPVWGLESGVLPAIPWRESTKAVQ